MTKKIYGVDISKPVTPLQARDAIIKCFYNAHKVILDDMKNYTTFESKKELDEMEKLNVEIMIKNMFKDTNGDFNNPDKESLKKVIDKLAEYAKHFRNPGLIKQHYKEIMMILKQVE